MLTTPYGISGQMDRSGATQLTALIELLSARFRIAALELIDGHIGVVASPSPRPAQTSEVWRRALQLSEQVMAAVATESGVVAQQAREQLAATLRRVEELDRTMSVAEARLEEMEQDADLLTEALREREQLLVSVQGEQHALLDAYSAAKHGVIALRRRLAAIEQEGENGIAVAAELPVAPAPVDGGYGAAQQPDPELERLHPEVARLEAELAQAVQERDAAQHEADAAASEIAVLQQEVGKAHAQAEAATEATVALERVLERANSEVARLTQQVAVVETQPAKPRRSSKR